jgi:hypothetical protein
VAGSGLGLIHVLEGLRKEKSRTVVTAANMARFRSVSAGADLGSLTADILSTWSQTASVCLFKSLQ